MKAAHLVLLIVGILLIVSGVLAPWLGALRTFAQGAPSDSSEVVLPALRGTYLALLIGIPVAAAGCVVVASAIVAHVFRSRRR